MRQKNKNRENALWMVLSAVLAMLLIVSILVGVTAKTKKVYIPAPPDAADDFSGVMLSDYDNLSIHLMDDYISFDFGKITLLDYDFIAIDLLNARIMP